jgi:hypothetical protein
MKNIATIDFIRARFDRVKGYYAPKGLAPAISQIRIEQPLINGQGVYRFDIKKEILSASEQNLKRNDLFVVCGIGLYPCVSDPTKPGTEQLFTFAKKGDADITGFNTEDLNALYNGKLYISTGSTVNIEDQPLNVFKRVPNMSGNAFKENLPLEFDFLDSLHMMPEELILAGTQDHKIEISFPTFAASDYSTLPAGTIGKLALVIYGYKVPGGTAEQYKNDQANPYRFAI